MSKLSKSQDTINYNLAHQPSGVKSHESSPQKQRLETLLRIIGDRSTSEMDFVSAINEIVQDKLYAPQYTEWKNLFKTVFSWPEELLCALAWLLTRSRNAMCAPGQSGLPERPTPQSRCGLHKCSAKLCTFFNA